MCSLSRWCALDFGADGWLHSRMAVIRGAEDGLTVVRAAGDGRLTVSGPDGRVLGEARSSDMSLLLRAPAGGVGTVHRRTGDGIWILIFLAAGLAALAGRRSGVS